ncbi:MAG: rhomboid family intramembrane serine protease [Proteobacteria bacterium]|nr:rhomboid family intramembrane serine protease [Pseudomonadota bacterium]
MFPLRDENPTVRTAFATLAFIGLNVASWVWLQGLGSAAPLTASVCEFGLIPGAVLGLGSELALASSPCAAAGGGGSWATLLTSMFMHGGWFHILGNLWFLWVFGDNVEDAMGPARFVAFYLLCGLAAAGAQMLSHPGSLIPMVGASGAIGGVMGGYARLYPRARVQTLLVLGFYVTMVSLPAWGMLGYWFALQVLGGLPSLVEAQGAGVAFWAHVGGFAAGLALVGPFSRTDYLAEHRAQQARALPRLRRRSGG